MSENSCCFFKNFETIEFSKTLVNLGVIQDLNEHDSKNQIKSQST
jgi:hypothetical protein